MIDLMALHEILDADEDEHLDFKEAKSQFDSEKLIRYCVALANEGGGRLVLGVTNARPRKVVGSMAFPDLGKKKHDILESLRIRVEAYEIRHSDGRVVIFDVPSRHIGTALNYKGCYWMRSGESLVLMSEDQLRRIFTETGPDFSADICANATVADLDSEAIERFRRAWQKKSRNDAVLNASETQLLSDAELIHDGGVTFAALILLGTPKALSRQLAHSEVIFEYRSSEVAGPAQHRVEFRRGFFLFYEDLWKQINLRNDTQHLRDGLFVWDIPTFNENVVREAVLNAVSHRDYRLGGSVFVRQYPKRLEIESPGSFPAGITPENILYKHLPRNRRIAEAFSKCGLVERSGQGVNLMFEHCIRESKPTPDYSRSDEYTVNLRLDGEIQDPRFLRFLEKIGDKQVASFTTDDLLVLDCIRNERQIPHPLKPRVHGLLASGVIERFGKGRGVKHILSSTFYEFLGKQGVHTRKRGLDRDTNKELLVKHIATRPELGSPLNELRQVLPSLTPAQVQGLLRELRREGRIHSVGHTKAGRWFTGPVVESTGKKVDCHETP